VSNIANIFNSLGNIFRQRSLTQSTFNGEFSPGEPLKEAPIAGTPRLNIYPTGINLTPPQAEKRISYEYLRKISREYDLLARCLSRRKEEIANLHWSIQPRERTNKKRMREIQEKYADDIKMITEFFEHPEGYMDKVNGKWVRFPVTDYQYWMNAALDDLYVIGAMAIYPRRKKNGELLSLERIQADTIKILRGIDGRPPLPPEPAFQQWIHGVPRENFTLRELVYRVYNPTNDNPYGYSLVEQILAHVQMAQKSEKYIDSYFSEGSIPEILFQVPAEWTQQQIEEFAAYMNARLKGNPNALREFNPIPGGTKPIELRPFQWDSKFVNWVATMTCVLCGVQPHEMGIVPQESGLGGKSFGEMASDIHDKQTTWVAQFLQNLFTDIIKYHFGNDELCFVFDHLLEKEEKERAEINEILIRTGQKSIDQILVENGEQPEGINRFFQAGDRLYGLPDLLALSTKGSVAVNLGQIGGIPMPDDTFTEDVQITQNAPGSSPDVVTPNPNQSKDPSAKLDTSHTEAPEENKSKPPKPPKQPKGTSYPTGPTVNTVRKKTVVADVVKDTQDDKERERETHELELMFLAAFYRIFKRVAYTNAMLNNHLVLAAFAMTPQQRQALYDALYTLKRDVYIESYNTYAREHGLHTISSLDAKTDAAIRADVAKSVDSIASTYMSDLQSVYDSLVASGVSSPRELLDKLNDWLKQRNRWKGKQIVLSEISKPWNDAILAVDKRVGVSDERHYIVQPDTCVCNVCREMVANNPYTYEEAMNLPIPAHPGCVHFITSVSREGGGE
jgi:hypothetical protein